MRRVPWWTVVSATGAPVLLIGGWTLAAARQPAGYDSFTETISSLAALGATDRWLMTGALLGVGACHAVTALGLRPAAIGGRALLATGGVATVLVALFPLPRTGGSASHTVAAALAFGALAVWPALALHRGRRATDRDAAAVVSARPANPASRPNAGPGGRPGHGPAAPGAPPWALRPRVSVTAAAVLLGLVGWFVVALAGHGKVGLAERAAAGAQALWPLAVVLSARRSAG